MPASESGGAIRFTSSPRQKNMSPVTPTIHNLLRRPPTPSKGRGPVQQACKRALHALGTASTSDCIGFAYARRLLIGGERRRNGFNISVRRALLSAGAKRLGRATTRGRPWLWTWIRPEQS